MSESPVPAIDPSDVCVVLVRPRYAENVGATARALENAGAGELRLVAPNTLTQEGIAARVARGGEARLLAARTFDSLGEAIHDVDVAIATSHRGGRHRQPLSPWAMSGAILADLRPRRIALVMGPEDSGLTRDDIDACHRLVSIPSHGPMNLAQTVMVLLYELCMRPRADVGQPVKSAHRRADTRLEDRADRGSVPRIVATAERALAATGYPRHPRPMKQEMARLADILSRTPLSRWETNFLVGLFRHLELSANPEAGHMNEES